MAGRERAPRTSSGQKEAACQRAARVRTFPCAVCSCASKGDLDSARRHRGVGLPVGGLVVRVAQLGFELAHCPHPVRLGPGLGPLVGTFTEARSTEPVASFCLGVERLAA